MTGPTPPEPSRLLLGLALIAASGGVFGLVVAWHVRQMPASEAAAPLAETVRQSVTPTETTAAGG